VRSRRSPPERLSIGPLEPMGKTGFGFYRIHILQSLPEGEWNTGLHLLRFLEDLPDTHGHLQFEKVQTKQEMFGALGNIKDTLMATGQIPLVHLEAHGNPDGLRLSSGEFVEWHDLRASLTDINVRCQLNLFIALSACSGEILVSMIRLSEPAPFWGCIGPRSEELSGTLHDSFKAFYHRLLESGDFRAALDAAGAGLPTGKRTLTFWPAEFFFVAAFREYLIQQCGEEKLKERAEWIAQELKKTGQNVSSEIKKSIAADLANHEHYFNKYRGEFLMLDRYPHNAGRFTANYSHLALSPTVEQTDTAKSSVPPLT